VQIIMREQRYWRTGCLIVLMLTAHAAAQSGDADWRSDDLQGIARPSKQVTLTAPFDGVLDELPVSEGDNAEPGELVARMDEGVQQAAVAAARLRADVTASMRQAKLKLAEAEIQHERFREAFEQDAASDWEVRRAKLQRDQAAAEIDILKEQRELAEAEFRLERERLKRHGIHAPFAGRIVRKAVEAGATLARADSIVSLVDLDPLEAEIHLPAEMYGQLAPGMQVRLRAGAPVDAQLAARVKTVIPLIDPASRTFRCVFVINNPEQKMPGGFKVRLIPPESQ
jgi:RND family efflux transporter MFP subunit